MTLKKMEEGIYAQESTPNEIRDIDGIIFDCDGVLIDVSNSYDLAIQRTTTYILKEIANISKFDPVTSKIIDAFKATFKKNKNSPVSDVMNKITKPEILDELIPTNEFRHKWYLEKPEDIVIEMTSPNYEEEKRMKEDIRMQEEAHSTINKFKEDFHGLNNLKF